MENARAGLLCYHVSSSMIVLMSTHRRCLSLSREWETSRSKSQRKSTKRRCHPSNIVCSARAAPNRPRKASSALSSRRPGTSRARPVGSRSTAPAPNFRIVAGTRTTAASSLAIAATSPVWAPNTTWRPSAVVVRVISGTRSLERITRRTMVHLTHRQTSSHPNCFPSERH